MADPAKESILEVAQRLRVHRERIRELIRQTRVLIQANNSVQERSNV